jgi:hypothetical protein
MQTGLSVEQDSIAVRQVSLYNISDLELVSNPFLVGEGQ